VTIQLTYTPAYLKAFIIKLISEFILTFNRQTGCALPFVARHECIQSPSLQIGNRSNYWQRYLFSYSICKLISHRASYATQVSIKHTTNQYNNLYKINQYKIYLVAIIDTVTFKLAQYRGNQ